MKDYDAKLLLFTFLSNFFVTKLNAPTNITFRLLICHFKILICRVMY